MFKRLEELAATARRALATPQSPIRPMRPEDLSEVLRMIRLHDDDDYRAAQRSFAHHNPEQRPEHGAHFVYIDPQELRPLGVIGYSVDDLEARGTYWLGWTYVNPFSRGKGIGAQLMAFNLAALRALGARKLFLSTSSLPKYQAAVGFYQRHGFAEEGRLLDFYAPGEHKILMGCDLRGAQTQPRPPQRERDTTPDAMTRPTQPPQREAPKRDDEVVFEF